MKQTTPKRRLAWRITRVGRYLIPFYPLLSTYLSMKGMIRSGVATWRCPSAESAGQRNPPRIVTFREALAQRPANALPLENIERLCWRRKRIMLASGFLALCGLCGSVLGGNTLSACLSVLAVSCCGLAVVKYAHRLWQIERGRMRPDKPMESLRVFFATSGVGWRLLDPCLFE